jgi:hypothetical protein
MKSSLKEFAFYLYLIIFVISFIFLVLTVNILFVKKFNSGKLFSGIILSGQLE